MINKIIEGAVKNRILVLMAFVLILIWGFVSMRQTPVDAIPDIGEMQVIVYADWPGRSPKDVEDQVIYPLTTGLMGTPKVKVVRSMSAFGFGLVNMIFEEGTPFYWARTRVLEKLDFAKKDVPKDAAITLGPDATALGQVFWYTVEGDGYGIEKLRSLQDWYVRYQLTAVDGVAEVASVGGFVKQYQIDIDPNKLFSYGVNLHQVIKAVEKSNRDVGAKVFEKGGKEFVVRGLGFIRSVKDIENIVVAEKGGVPVYVKNLGRVTTGPDFRRGALDKKGKEAVGGVVLMRYGENPLKVIKNVKKKIKELSAGLPKGVEIVPFYDRTGLILRAVDTLRKTLAEEILVTAIVVSLFLLHFWASAIVSLVLPVGILIAFILMKQFGVNSNIMSLGGIAIAIGVMVDSGSIMVENIYRKLANKRRERGGDLPPPERLEIVVKGAQEMGKPVLFSLLITIIGFLPVFVLTGQAGKLFVPLAFTKTFVMAGAAVIALTLSPLLSYYFLRGKLRPLEDNKFTALLHRMYRPAIKWSLARKKIIAGISALLVGGAVVSLSFMKQEFMPPLNEGDLLFMPVLLPGASLTQVMDVMKKQDRIIESLPEVKGVVGKLGRAETPTDPAPVGMIETVIGLKDKKYWREGMTREKLIREIIEKTKMPGVSPIMTQPIRNRIDMLATGIQTPVGVKVFGSDLEKIVEIAVQLEGIIAKVKGAQSPYAERTSIRPYFEIEINRKKAARYGINVDDIQHVVMMAVGGINLTTSIEGRERYPVRIRYMRELRDNPDALDKILVSAPGGKHIPLSQLASLKLVNGPAVLNSENTLTYARVFVNVKQDEVGLIDFVENAQEKVEEEIKSGRLKIPPGYFISWSGQFESEMESRKRLLPSVAISLFVIFILLYMAFRKFSILLISFTAVPIGLTGGVMLLYILGFKLSTAVWVGMIALFGVAVENGVVLLDTLENMFRGREMRSKDDINELAVKASLLRVRPSLITTATTILALLPAMFSSGTGSEIIKPMAAPTVGGLVTATLSNLILVPVLYTWLKEREIEKLALQKGKNTSEVQMRSVDSGQ